MPLRGRLPLLQGRIDEIPDEVVVETRDGVTVRVSPDGMYHSVYFWGDYEPYNTKIYKRIVRPGHVVFDVGANFGWYAVLFARWVGEQGAVHAFEPVPFIHSLAADTLALNRVKSNVTLNLFALGREPGSLTIRTYPGLPHGHATASNLPRADAVLHRCQMSTLDAYCESCGIEKIDFVKVDVEGWEPDVFEGGLRMLSSADAPVIAFEVNAECLQARSLASADVFEPLRETGYSHFYRFSTRTGMRRLKSSDFVDGDCIAAKSPRVGELSRALRANRFFR